MLSSLDNIIILGYLAIILFIGFRFRKTSGRDMSSYFLGGRNLPWWLAGLSMVATTFAADTPLVVTELVANNGIAGNWLWWNMLVGGMLTTFFFARLWRSAGVLTELEFVQIRYSGRKATILRASRAVYIALIMNTLIIAWVNIALMTIIEVFWGLEHTTLLLVMFAAMFLSALYSAASGLKGIVITDAVQFFIAMAGAVILAVLVIRSDEIGGITGLKAQLPKEAFNFFPVIGETKNVSGVLSLSIGSFLAYGLVQWWASWYPGAEPGGGGYIAQRMLSTKNERHSVLATLFFQTAHYAVRPWPWILVALASVALYPDLTPEKVRFGYVYAMRDFLPTGLKGLMLVAFLSAYMSTISTQLNFASSILTNDFTAIIKPQLTQKQLVKYGRYFTFVIMILSLLATSVVKTISGVWLFMIECGAGLGLVLILRWYWWRINAWSELTAMIVPFILFAASKFMWNLEFPNSFFITVAGTTVAWLTVTFLTKPTDKEVLTKFYERIKPQGFWKPFRGSGEKQNIIYLFGAWISSVILVYSILFFIGKVIFREWDNVLICSLFIVISALIFRFCTLPCRGSRC